MSLKHNEWIVIFLFELRSNRSRAHFLIPSLPPKTEMYPSTRDNLDHILTLTRSRALTNGVIVGEDIQHPNKQKNRLRTTRLVQ